MSTEDGLHTRIDAARMEESDRWLHDYTQQAAKIKELEAEIEQLQTLRLDIITAINRPQTITDKGLLMYIRDEIDVNTRQANKIQELENEIKRIGEYTTDLEDKVDWGISEPTYGGEVL